MNPSNQPLFRIAVIGVIITATLLLLHNVFYSQQGDVVSTAMRQSLLVKGSGGDGNVNLWLFALDCETPHLNFYAKQAVLSALHHTHLIPILMMHCKNEEIESWMVRHNVTIVDPEASKLVKFLDKNPERLTNLGATTWYRMAIPEVLDHLLETKHESVMQFVRTNKTIVLEYVLYTDADVVFMRDVRIPPSMLPRYFALPIQGNNWCCSKNPFSRQVHANAGVILMNISALRDVKEEFIGYVEERILQNDVMHPTFNDQTAFHSFFPIRFRHLNIFKMLYMYLYHSTYFKTLATKYYSEVLPKEFEWEPYLGVNEKAVIMHWHGPKVNFEHCDMLRAAPYAVASDISDKINATSQSTSRRFQPLVLQANQIVLKQLMLHNRTDFTVSIRKRLSTESTADTTTHPAFSLRTTPLQSYRNGGEEREVPVLYPPLYDWYSPMKQSDTNTAKALVDAEKSFFFLQTLTKDSLDGYQHAVELFFAYMHVICDVEH